MYFQTNYTPPNYICMYIHMCVYMCVVLSISFYYIVDWGVYLSLKCLI